MTLTMKNFKSALLAVLITVGYLTHCTAAQAESIVVAGGCFWCVEHDFEKVPGVTDAVSGYTGGSVANPTYKQVTRQKTGHYEAVKITFDPAKISREKLLNMFFRSIDPTDAGGQFCDRGPSYRSAIFVSNSGQRQAAEAAKASAQSALGRKVVTPILQAGTFYAAEAYHQDYSRSSKKILTRFGRKSKAEAYKLYRQSCGRDKRVRTLWGSAAPFVGG